ncbi:MAG: FAD-dependent oxidoreductase [Bacteroidetes bacterium]|nr:MAG: FAD-dependent oxidoreductase [Bacteroidota bacterium]
MNSSAKYDVIIVGGGLAGLTCALHLSKHDIKILLIEKYEYPHHKVCGEYVSNEVLPYLRSLGIDPFTRGAVEISKFEISNKDGKKVTSELPLGGFGISRYAFDQLLYEKLKDSIDVVFETAEKLTFNDRLFTVRTIDNKSYHGKFLVGAFGKRSLLDIVLNRKFIRQRSTWLGVKAHYEYNISRDTVALHNFDGGYCGLSQVETGAVNACYLTTFRSFQRCGSIDAFQKKILSQNPHLDHFFKNAKLLFEKPLTISQISFEKKKPVEAHIFMIGDSAGLIHPLCGNGMAMAIHSAKLFSELFLKTFQQNDFQRERLEVMYKRKWEESFTRRLQTGRMIQNLLLHPASANIGLKLARAFPSVIPKIIKKTHGDLLI